MYVRVLVVHQGDQWLAQALEFDLAAQGPTDKSAVDAFLRLFKARARHDHELGKQPFASLPPAPDSFFEAWDRLSREDEAPNHFTPADDFDDDDLPPAYILQAIAKNSTDVGCDH